MQIRIIYFKGKSDATFVRTLSYAKGFVQNGASVRFSFLLPPEKNWHMESYDGIERDDVYKSCPNILKKSRLTTYFYSICRLARSIKQGDILFFSLPYFNTIIASRARRKRANFFMEFTEIPYYEIKPGFLRYVQSTSQLIAAKRADFVCVISKGLAKYYQGKGVSRVHVINMFVDIDRFISCQETDISCNPNLISYCGSLYNSKDGIDILIKAFAIVHESHPDAHLRIIGSASDPILNALIELATNLGIIDSVEFTGRVPFEAIPDRIRESGILALARPSSSQAQYGFPTKLGEYLCTSRPVVITKTGEIDLFLKDKVSCIFAKPDDVEDFASKLNWCLDNYQEATNIGAVGKNVARDNFSARTESKKVLDILKSQNN